jgi:hypothetical protein
MTINKNEKEIFLSDVQLQEDFKQWKEKLAEERKLIKPKLHLATALGILVLKDAVETKKTNALKAIYNVSPKQLNKQDEILFNKIIDGIEAAKLKTPSQTNQTGVSVKPGA